MARATFLKVIIKKACFFFISILLSLSVGIVLALLIAQETPWAKRALQREVDAAFIRITKEPFSCHIRKINLFTRTITGSFKAHGADNSWSIESDKTVVVIDWWHFIREKTMPTDVTFYNSHVYSRLKEKAPAVFEPVIRIIHSPTYLPLSVRSLTSHDTTFTGEDEEHHITLTSCFSHASQRTKTCFNTSLSYAQTRLSLNKSNLLHSTQGKAAILFNRVTDELVADWNCTCCLLASTTQNNCHGCFKKHTLENFFNSSDGKINQHTTISFIPEELTISSTGKLPWGTITLNAQQKNGLLRGECNGNYITATQQFPYQIELSTHDNQFTVSAHNSTYHCTGSGTLMPLSLEQVVIKDIKNKQPIASLTKQGTSLTGIAPWQSIAALLEKYGGLQCIPDGTCALTLSSNNGIPELFLSLNNTMIGIPHTGIRITKAQVTGTYNQQEKRIFARDLHITCSQGSLSSEQISFWLNTSGKPTYIHAPLILDQLLIHQKHKFTGLLSGDLTLIYAQHKATLSGALTLDQGTFAYNIFTRTGTVFTIPSSAQTTPITLALSLSTRQPLTIKTPFLHTQASCSLTLSGSSIHPELEGTIKLIGGTLSFPAVPLTIMQGQIEFSPHQAYDPFIHLQAQGRIKKHTVSLHVSGSLKHPRITLSSTPHLPHEHIVLLLLTGSEDGSLSLALPTLITHALEELLFGPEESITTLNKNLRTALSQLKKVRFTSKGLLEIDLNERVKALLDRSGHIELDYALCDEISARAAHTDIGDKAELEMRWKF